MRKRYTRIVWKTIHIDLELLTLTDVSSSIKKSLTKEEFFSGVIDLLANQGYFPKVPVPIMKRALKSPYSDSEYYVFLKVEDEVRLKVVLDIRLSNHPLPEYGNYTAYDRHIHHMEEEKIPDIAIELGLDSNKAQAQFTDVIEQLGLISINQVFYNSYTDALEGMRTIVDSLP